jgi:hypothetical protein
MLRVQLGAMYGSDAHLQRLTEGIGVEVVAAFLTLLVGFHDQRVHFGVGVVTNSGDLPGNLHAGAAAREWVSEPRGVTGEPSWPETSSR